MYYQEDDDQGQVNVNYTGMAKAFDHLHHDILLDRIDDVVHYSGFHRVKFWVPCCLTSMFIFYDIALLLNIFYMHMTLKTTSHNKKYVR